MGALHSLARPAFNGSVDRVPSYKYFLNLKNIQTTCLPRGGHGDRLVSWGEWRWTVESTRTVTMITELVQINTADVHRATQAWQAEQSNNVKVFDLPG
jgi:hypothetical protein